MADDDLSLARLGASGSEPAAFSLGAQRERTVDEHMFRPFADRPGWSFRLQLFTAAGRRPVVVVTQTLTEGMTLTTGAEQYAEAVWEQLCPGEVLPPLWVQRQLLGDELDWGQSEFELVEFAETEQYRLRQPQWWPVTFEQMARLVGGLVDGERGEGYIPREPEPEPELRFEVLEVSRLGEPHPFRAPECMPDGSSPPVPWWRRLARSLAGRGCCWYHQGDWRVVSEFAVAVLAEGVAAGVEARDMAGFAVRRAVDAGMDRWQRQALDSLFGLDSAITPDGVGGFVNGQHRTRAMLDAGVHQTVVLKSVWPEK
ncbi:hypothetical protein AB0K51_19060 [Kitasatospora sp. NPDC049285]|uniref:hypothetical protein n=1 Tax=Kitasatospora sp. NPDC049285 TaxID=3157096 RepID=UPI00343A55ED